MSADDYQSIPDNARRIRAGAYFAAGLIFLVSALLSFAQPDGDVIGGYLMLPAIVGTAGGIWTFLRKRELTMEARDRREAEQRRAQLERERRSSAFWSGVWGWVGGLCFLGCLLVLGVQGLTYLRNGYWMPVSTLEIPAWFGSEWASNPTTWFGLHEIMDKVPLTVALFVVSAALISYSEMD